MNAAKNKSSRDREMPLLTRRRVWFCVGLALIALVGLADATYLAVMHLTGDDAVCGASTGCAAVLGSAYASIGRIPTAAFGGFAYFLVFASAVCVGFGYAGAEKVLLVAIAAMLLVTLGLLYLQAFVLHAFCPFCLLSAACTFLLAGVLIAAWPLLRGGSALPSER